MTNFAASFFAMNNLATPNNLSLMTALLVPLALAYVLGFYALTWKRPWLALLLVFALSPFQNDLSGGVFARFSIAEINLALTIPLLLMKRRRLHIGPIGIPVFLYLLVCLIASFYSPRDTTLNAMLQMVLYLVIAVVVFASLARDEEDFKPALNSLVVVGVLFSLLSLSSMYERLDLNKNGVGSSLSCAAIVCCELWFSAKGVRRKTWLASALAFIFLGLLMTLSRGAWLGAAVGLVVLCSVRGQYRLLLRTVLVAVPLLAVAWFALPQKSKDYAMGFDAAKNYNIKLRYQSLTLAQDKFEESPILGVGVGLRKEYDATNIVMLTLAETGVVGLVTFSLVHIVLLVTVWQTRRKIKRSDPLFSLVALGGALVLARLAHGMVDHYWSRGAISSSWAAAGMAIFAYYAVRRRARAEKLAQLAFQQNLHEGARDANGNSANGNSAPLPAFARSANALWTPSNTQSSTRSDSFSAAHIAKQRETEEGAF